MPTTDVHAESLSDVPSGFRLKFFLKAFFLTILLLSLTFGSVCVLFHLGVAFYAASDSGATFAGLPVFEIYMAAVQTLFMGTVWFTDLLGEDPQGYLIINGFAGVLVWWVGLVSLVFVLRRRRKSPTKFYTWSKRTLFASIAFIAFGGVYGFTRHHISCVPEFQNHILGATPEEAARNAYYRYGGGAYIDGNPDVKMTEIFAPSDAEIPSLNWAADSRYFIIGRSDGTREMRIGVRPNYGGPRCEGWSLRYSGPVRLF